MEQIIIPPVDLTLVAPVLTVFAWAAALLLVDVFAIPAGSKKITGYLAIVGLIVAGLVAIPLWNVSGSTFSGMITLDRFSLSLTWIFLLVGVLSIAMALEYLPRNGIEQGEFYPLILFAVGGMILLAQGTNLIVLFLAVELLSITLYILTGFAYPKVSSEEAGMKYLVLGAFAAGFFVYGIALTYGATGTVSLAGINEYLSLQTFVAVDHSLLLAGAALILIAFSFKIALAPFHMWTPDVYEGSPTPVAAFMSVGTKGAALAALLRILTAILPMQAVWLPVLAGLALLSMLVGNFGALAQSNLKRMLAYSSIGHAGYLMLGVMTVSEYGTQAFLFYMLAYALTNLGAFAVLIALEQRGERADTLDSITGLFKRQPLLAGALAIFMLSLAGVPPTAGLMGKIYLFSAAWESGLAWLALVGIFTSAVAAFFYIRIIVRMFMQDASTPVEAPVSRGISLDIALAVVGTLVVGLMPNVFIFLAERSLLAVVGS